MTSEVDDWTAWREARHQRLLGPRSPLALTGTHWFEDTLQLDGVPGQWRATGATAVLTATADDGVLVDGVLLNGAAVVRSDLELEPTHVAVGELRLLLIDRDGALAVRVYDPAGPARSGFSGLDLFDFDASWVLPATFTPFDETRQVVVPNADGVARPLPLGGTVTFSRNDIDVALQVEMDEEHGDLQAVFSDATAQSADPARRAYRFRFVNFPPPDSDGVTVADLNQAFLPPCAFNEFFVCPFPPPGNTLDLAIEAGERAARW
ncbi:DUF1684 domain-containing protein [Angustibacter sp. McL0619]|uniref:DUF1684 domain-containing protein n=1 Tax=Angustibacter sp. McL0619 TaxID=3415676 RepID=UPI003CF22BD0